MSSERRDELAFRRFLNMLLKSVYGYRLFVMKEILLFAVATIVIGPCGVPGPDQRLKRRWMKRLQPVGPCPKCQRGKK